MNIFALGSQLSNLGASSNMNKSKARVDNSLWKERTDSGAYDEMRELNPDKASMQEYMDKLNADAGTLIERLQDMKTGDDTTIIYAKLQSGKKLSPSELETLRHKDPDAYAKAMQIEAERKAYERELRSCKTKEDVKRLQLNRLGTIAARVGSIVNNPNIPEGQKLGMLVHENNRANAVRDVTARFVKSAEYANMPTEAEVNEEYKAERESKEQAVRESMEQNAQRTEDAQQKADDGTDTAPPEAAEDPSANGTAEQSGATVGTDYEPREQAQPDAPRRETDAPSGKASAPEPERTPAHMERARDAYRRGAATKRKKG